MNGIKYAPRNRVRTPIGNGTASGKYTVVTVPYALSEMKTFPPWKLQAYRAVPYVHIASTTLVFFIVYLRYTFTIQGQRQNGFAWLPWLFFLAELCSMGPKYNDDVWRFFASPPPLESPPQLRLIGNNAPTVDVIVTACREHATIVLDTAHAACVLDYPLGKFRVIVSDDGSDPEVELKVRQLQKKYPHLHYFTRNVNKLGRHHGFKAGNINAAVKFAATLKDGPAEFFTALDVDMIPEPPLLRALLARIVNDPLVAMVSVPQHFYNQPTNDPLLQSHTIGNEFDEVMRDSVGTTWCSGTGFVVRSAAMTELGGFDETTLAEDVLCSMMLYGQGWKVVYVREQLQWGLVPPDFASHIKQRTKWHVGAMQNSVKLRFCLGGAITRRMTFHQRLSGITYCLQTWSCTIMFLPPLLIIPICLLSGNDLVSIGSTSQLQFILCLSWFSALLGRLNEYLSSFPTGYKMVRQHDTGQLWMTHLFLYHMVREWLPLRWGGQRMGFTASGSVKSVMNERNELERAPLKKRIEIVLFEYGVWFHVSMLAFVAITIAKSIITATAANPTTSGFWRAMIVRILWPGIPWQQYFALLTPITYTLWPPSVPERRRLMVQDPGTGVWRSRPGAQGEHYDIWILRAMVVPVLSLGLHALACVLSFSVGDVNI